LPKSYVWACRLDCHFGKSAAWADAVGVGASVGDMVAVGTRVGVASCGSAPGTLVGVAATPGCPVPAHAASKNGIATQKRTSGIRFMT
jgi:hypothetical protein